MVVATEALSAHSDGIDIFYRRAEHLLVKALQNYGANVVRFQMASSDRRWFIVGFYLAPDNASTLEDVFVAISQRPRGAALLVVCDFNTALAAPEGRGRDAGIAAAMA